MTNRDAKTGRFARRPVPDADATEVNPMGSSIEDIDNVSGAPSANTIERPRYSPAGDDLAQGGARFPLRARHPTLVSLDEEARTRYGVQGALTRDAARLSGLTGTLGYAIGVDDSAGPSRPVQDADDTAVRRTRTLPGIGRTDEAPAPTDTGLDNPGRLFR